MKQIQSTKRTDPYKAGADIAAALLLIGFGYCLPSILSTIQLLFMLVYIFA